MTGAADDGEDGAPRSAPSNEPLAGDGSGASAANDTAASGTSPTIGPVSSATALRGRSNVYEKFLNKKMDIDDEGPTAFGKRIQAAAGVIEVSNSNGGFLVVMGCDSGDREPLTTTDVGVSVCLF
jgi:hypothetical protein